MDNGAGVTWQKAGLLVALIAVLLPIVVSGAIKIVFPPDYLLYELQEPIEGKTSTTAAIIVTNAGTEPQEDIVIKLTTKDISGDGFYFDVGKPMRYRFLFSSDSRPDTKLSMKDGSAEIRLGRLMPDEAIRVTLLAEGDLRTSLWMVFRNMRVESKVGLAREADGLRYPDFDGSAHGFLRQGAPYMLALIFAAMGLILVGGMLYSIFFDSTEKQMARLWKQMDVLQEKADKERRYRIRGN